MINTVDQLQALLLKQADLENDPIFKRPSMMISYEISNNKLELLKKNLVTLPQTFFLVDSTVSDFEFEKPPW